jgi:HAE1 family hydrophobic/amphiphilic exporter-1
LAPRLSPGLTCLHLYPYRVRQNRATVPGDAINAIKEVAKTNLPAGYDYEFSGLTREELSTGSQSAYIFMLCLVFVYFLLSAQYESYILPFAVLLSLPVGLAGTYLFATIFLYRQ